MLSIGIWSFCWVFLLYVEQVNSYTWDQHIFFWEGLQALSVAFEVFFTMDFFRVAKEKLNTSDPVFPCGKILYTNFSKTPCSRDYCALESSAIAGINMFIFACTHIRSQVYHGSASTYCIRSSVRLTMRLSVSDPKREGAEVHCCIGGWMYELEFLNMCTGRIEENCVHVQTNGAYLQLKKLMSHYKYTWVQLMSFKRYEVTLSPNHRNFSKSRPHLQAFDDQPSSGEISIETSEADAREDAPVGTESWNEGFYDQSRIVKVIL